MNNGRDVTTEFLIGCCICVVAICAGFGCVSGKLMNKDYFPTGEIKRETCVSYYRWFNQSIDGVEIITELFTARVEEQEADQTPVIEAGGSALGNVVKEIVTP